MSQTQTAIVERANVALSTNGAIVKSFDDLARLSTMIFKSGLAPQNMNTPEKIGVAIMWGMEVGLSPIQSIQSIAVINNRPCMWGDALPALVQSSPVCEYVQEELQGEGDAMVAICISKRRSAPNNKTSRFSVADAKKAGLWGKAGPWQNYPKRMLQLRARTYNFRDNFADVLRGIGIAEEQQDIVTETPLPAAVEIVAAPALPAKSELDDFIESPAAPAADASADTIPPDEQSRILAQEQAEANR
jgi:hypothetical protein